MLFVVCCLLTVRMSDDKRGSSVLVNKKRKKTHRGSLSVIYNKINDDDDDVDEKMGEIGEDNDELNKKLVCSEAASDDLRKRVIQFEKERSSLVGLLMCPVMMTKMEMPVTFESCMHTFSYTMAVKLFALAEESALKPLCPTCRKPISTKLVENQTSLIHNQLHDILFPNIKIDWSKTNKPTGPETNISFHSQFVASDKKESTMVHTTVNDVKQVINEKLGQYETQIRLGNVWAETLMQKLHGKMKKNYLRLNHKKDMYFVLY